MRASVILSRQIARVNRFLEEIVEQPHHQVVLIEERKNLALSYHRHKELPKLCRRRDRYDKEEYPSHKETFYDTEEHSYKRCYPMDNRRILCEFYNSIYNPAYNLSNQKCDKTGDSPYYIGRNCFGYSVYNIIHSILRGQANENV